MSDNNKNPEKTASQGGQSANHCYKDDTLTPEQIENWRRVLCRMIGPYALMMPVEDIQRFRNKTQNDVNKIRRTESV